MDRNALTRAAAAVADAASQEAARLETAEVCGVRTGPEVARLIQAANALQGSAARFANDLCHCPTLRNRMMGATCYTLKEAARQLAELKSALAGIRRAL